MKNTGEVRNSRLVRSAFVFAACYVVLLVVMFLMIVINDPAGWTRYFVEKVADILTLCVCTFCCVSSFTTTIISRIRRFSSR